MTHDEFDRWLEHHSGLFPNVGKWLAGQPAEVLAAWQRRLSTFAFGDVCAASEALANQEQQVFPSDHPRELGNLVISKNRRAVNEERGRRVRCLLCEDDGFVIVGEYRDALVGGTIRQIVYQESTLCGCEKAREIYDATVEHNQDARKSPRRLPRQFNRATDTRFADMLNREATEAGITGDEPLPAMFSRVVRK